MPLSPEKLVVSPLCLAQLAGGWPPSRLCWPLQIASSRSTTTGSLGRCCSLYVKATAPLKCYTIAFLLFPKIIVNGEDNFKSWHGFKEGNYQYFFVPVIAVSLLSPWWASLILWNKLKVLCHTHTHSPASQKERQLVEWEAGQLVFGELWLHSDAPVCPPLVEHCPLEKLTFRVHKRDQVALLDAMGDVFKMGSSDHNS